jgi:hypothetical protein
MYYAYLKPKSSDSGCRGGLSDGDSFVLEIDTRLNCDPELLALAAHEPEIMEFLKGSSSPIASMILRSIRALSKKLKETS